MRIVQSFFVGGVNIVHIVTKFTLNKFS